MHTWTIASYTKKNTNSKISVHGAMLVGTKRTTTIIRGKDGRGKTPLLQIKTIKGVKREMFLPLWCGTYLSLTVPSVCSLMLGKFNPCFVMSNKRGMERSNILLMVGSGNISTLAMRRTFLTIQGILDLVLAPMEWIFSERWGTHTVLGQLLCVYTIFLYGCAIILISGPKQASVDIDVFLEPLMEDMQKLWEHGVNVWDKYKKQYFNLKVIIFYMINDNLTCLALIGQVKEKTWCVICMD
jgi:hypothetical protein